MDDKRKFRAIMIAIVLAALFLRVAGDFGRGYPFSFYPDEDNNVERSVNFYRPETGRIELNPHWFNKPTFTYYVNFGVYGFYYLFGRHVTHRFPDAMSFGVHFMNDRGRFFVLGRLVNGIVGTLTVIFLYRLVRRWSDRRTAAIAAAFLAVSAGHVEWCGVVKEDIWAAFFVVLGLLGAAKIERKGRPRDSVLAGLAIGFGYAAKYHPVVALPAILWAHFGGPVRSVSRKTRIALSGAGFVLGAFIGTPYSFLDPEGRGRITGILGFAGKMLGFGVGETDPTEGLAIVRQFGRLVWTVMGFGPGDWAWTIPLFLLTLLGFGEALRTARGRNALFALATLGFSVLALTAANDQWPRKNHCVLLYPMLAAFAASGLVSASRWFGGAAESRVSGRRMLLLFGLAVLVPLPGFSLYESVSGIVEAYRPPAAKRAFDWIQREIPAGATIVNDGGVLPLRASDERMLWVKDLIEKRIKSASADLEKATDPAARRAAANYLTRYAGYRKKYALIAQADAAYPWRRYDVIEVERPWQTESAADFAQKTAAYNDLWPNEPLSEPAEVAGTVEAFRRPPADPAAAARRRSPLLVDRPVDFWVVADTSDENFRKPLKRREWPGWAKFYDDLRAHYDAVEIPGEAGGPTIRIYDLRRRTETPSRNVIRDAAR